MEWTDIYDLETVNRDFEVLDYSKYLHLNQEPSESVQIDSNGSTAVLQQGLLRIWELIRTATPDSQMVQNFLSAQLQYASETWATPDYEKRLLFHLKRLQFFLIWERVHRRKSDFEHYIAKFLMKLVNYYSQEGEDSSHQIKSLLLETLNYVSEKKRNIQRSHTTKPLNWLVKGLTKKNKTFIPDMPLPALDLEEMRKKAGLHSKKKGNLLGDKQEMPSSKNSSVMHAIYKDSSRYKQFADVPDIVDVDALDFEINDKQEDLQRLDDLNEMAVSVRQEIQSKRLSKIRNKVLSLPPKVSRTMSRDRVLAISEESEKSYKETIRSQVLNEVDNEDSSEDQEDTEFIEITNRLRQITDFKDLLTNMPVIPLKKVVEPDVVKVFGRLRNLIT